MLERFATQYNQAPPAGTVDRGNPQLAEGREAEAAESVWWGVDPGNLRFGVAYVGDWGWVEGDLDLHWRLREEELGLDLRGFVNGRVGSAFRVTKNIKLGLGRLPTSVRSTSSRGSLGHRKDRLLRRPSRIPLFDPGSASGQADRGRGRGLGLSVAIGLRYAFGRGDTLGSVVPTQYDHERLERDNTVPHAVRPVATTVHEIAINFAAKVAF